MRKAMAMNKVTVSLDDGLYDEQAVRQTVKRFAGVVDVSLRRRGGRLVVTLAAEGDDVDRVAGEFVNIALAESLEKRS